MLHLFRVKVSYEAKIASGKRQMVRLELRIRTSNPGEYEVPDEKDMKILRLTRRPIRHEKMITSYRPLNGVFLIDKDAKYVVSVETNIQCAFVISVEKEDIDG